MRFATPVRRVGNAFSAKRSLSVFVSEEANVSLTKGLGRKDFVPDNLDVDIPLAMVKVVFRVLPLKSDV